MSIEFNISKIERQTVIDVIKGTCIIFVIITHYGWTQIQRLYCLFPFTIDMAVPIFMIITGYVYSNSFYRKGVTNLKAAYDSILLLKRILRYSIPFIITYCIECIWLYVTGENVRGLFWGFFTGGFGPGSYYYPEMIQIVFIFPVIFISINKNPKFVLILWFFINAFYEIVCSRLGIPAEVYRLLSFRHLFLLAFGCYIFIQRNNSVNKKVMRISCLVGFVYIFIISYLNYQTVLINNDWKGTSFITAFYIGPIVMNIIYRYGKFSFSLLETIGKASYNIFLVQMVYYVTVARIISKLVSSCCMQVFFNVIICITIGLIFYLIDNRITNAVVYWMEATFSDDKRSEIVD